LSGRSPDARIELPYEPPEEFDFLVSFIPLGGNLDVNQILHRSGRSFQWLMGARGNTVFGFLFVNGQFYNPTTRTMQKCLEPGRCYTSIVEVRRDGVRAYLDGRPLAEWKTDFQDMSLSPGSRLPNEARLGILAYDSVVVFHRIEVREVSGPGRLLR
jgi:hypothetical protein